jgi:two-component system sensor histidine kinase NblS
LAIKYTLKFGDKQIWDSKQILAKLLSRLYQLIRNWWAGFTLQTKLMALITLMVSLLMSGVTVTFWAVNDIQTDARLSDTRFGRDLGLLLADNVAPLVAKDDRTEIARLSKNFYASSSSIRYIIYADPTGEIYFGIPFSANEVQSSLSLRRRIQVPEESQIASNPWSGNTTPQRARLPMYLSILAMKADNWAF